MEHTKAVSDFASAYCLLYRSEGLKSYREKAITLLGKLEQFGCPTTHGMGWGLRFPFATRFVKAEATQPNIFQTVNAIHSFLDGYEALNDSHYFEIAERGFRFLEKDLGFMEEGENICWMYWQGLSVEIFNVSGLMIGLCGRMWMLTRGEQYLVYSQKLYHYIGSVQNTDGSWSYSADPRGRFIDGFHTGYIIEGICRGIAYGVLTRDAVLERGVKYYLENFFTPDGTPRYFHTSTFPIDGQNAAQAVQTLSFIFNANFAVGKLMISCFERIDYFLWNKKGYYNYKKTSILTYATPMHRWVTGPMFLALICVRQAIK